MSEPTFRDPDAATGERVESLLAELTLAEKVGQCVGTYVGILHDENTMDDAESAVRDHHLGSVSAFGTGSSPHQTSAAAAAAANRLQRVAVEETRLGIPLLLPVDAVHGNAYLTDATAFPHDLGLAAAFDPELAERVASVTAEEVDAVGGNQNYAPVCDVAREPRWGRTFETFGESPRLGADLAAAKVRGYQGDGLGAAGTVVATPKHFPAYGEPVRGEDTAPVRVGRSELHRDFLPPFEAAIDAGAESVMPCYNSIDGEAVHASHFHLTELLRADLGFDGFSVSDWSGVRMLHEDHRVTPSMEGAVRQTTMAGLDVASVGGVEHADQLLGLVEDGEVPESRIDATVRRVLRAKFELGLFEDPYVDEGDVAERVGTDDHRALALEAARESVALLRNDGLLPFAPSADEVLVTGPNADSVWHQLGGWSAIDGSELPGTSVLDGVRAVTDSDTTVTHEPGAGISEPADVDAAVAAAEDADIAVVALGEDWYVHEFGPAILTGHDAGEFPTRGEFALPDPQRDLLRRVHATGTPTALVLVTGRPLPIPWAAEHVDGILLSYYPGTEGGQAIAEALFGGLNPSGKLPISVPRSAGDLPQRFNHLPHPHPIGEAEHPESYDPLYPFGHGESYTEFAYRDLSLSADTVGPGGVVDAEATVENTGDRAGTETVIAFIRDEFASRVTPERELAGYAKLELEPGETATATIEVPVEEHGVVHPDGRRAVETGEFTLSVADLEASFSVESRF